MWRRRSAFPVILGRDFAGVVEQVGSGVSRHQVGDEAFGFLLHASPAVHDGSWAELITVPEDNFVAAKPRGLDLSHAGAAPLAGITALAAFDAIAPREGETVLVIGASGGVGSFFVQLAAAAGASVVALPCRRITATCAGSGSASSSTGARTLLPRYASCIRTASTPSWT